jgi:hypothetical protein
VIQRIDSIISSITLQLRLVFTATIQDSQAANVARLCKHVVNVLVGIFSNPTLAMGRELFFSLVSSFCDHQLNIFFLLLLLSN